jgi:hypothetical protein
MTPSSSSLPATGGTVTRRMDGHTINVVAVAPNRWKVAETIGRVVVGHGEIAALNGGYVMTTPTGSSSRGELWPELLVDYLHAAA